MGRAYAQELTLHASAAETVTGNSADFGYTPDNAIFTLDITAASGTSPTIDVTIEEKDPVSGKYSAVDIFPQQVGIVTVRRGFTGPIAGTIRASWVLGGTSPNFTFSLGAEGKQNT